MMLKLSAVLTALLLSTAALADSHRTAIHPSAEEAMPIMPGMMAPSFQVQDVHGNVVPFNPAELSRPVVISFFRGGWCPYCNLHLAEMRHAEQALEDMGFDVWFMSLDRPELLVDSLDEPDIGYTLYSDARAEASRGFGIAFRVADETYERYRDRADIDLEKTSGETHHVLPVPSTFIIGQDGLVHFAYSNPSYQVRLHPEVLLAAATAYRNDADQRLSRERKAQREAQKQGQ